MTMSNLKRGKRIWAAKRLRMVAGRVRLREAGDIAVMVSWGGRDTRP